MLRIVIYKRRPIQLAKHLSHFFCDCICHGYLKCSPVLQHALLKCSHLIRKTLLIWVFGCIWVISLPIVLIGIRVDILWEDNIALIIGVTIIIRFCIPEFGFDTVWDWEHVGQVLLSCSQFCRQALWNKCLQTVSIKSNSKTTPLQRVDVTESSSPRETRFSLLCLTDIFKRLKT